MSPGRTGGLFTLKLPTNDNYNAANGSVNVEIATADLRAGQDYTAPTDSVDLKYKAAEIPLLEDGNTGSVNIDSNTGAPVGTMKYAATRYRALSTSGWHIPSIDEVAESDIYRPIDNDGIYFPVGYKVQVGDKTYTYMMDSNGVNFYWSDAWHKCYFGGTNEPLNYTALKIKTIDKENKIITAEGVDYNTAFDALVNALQWNEEVPQRTDIGNWYVWYKVEGDINHNSTRPTYATSKIDYKKSTLTLAKTLGDFKVTEVANGTETEVTGNNGVYTLSATKTYKIYTVNTVSIDEKNKYRLTEAYHDKENDYDVFKYEYTLKLAVDSAFDTYTLLHNYNWTGKQYSNEADILYIADGEVTVETRQKAATLKGQSTYYYGDAPKPEDVEIEEGFKNIVNVESVSFLDSTGAVVTDLSKLKYGRYTLRAKLLIDSNANEKFNDKDIDSFVYISKEVEYKARPMVKNDYFLMLFGDKYKLEVDEESQTVTVILIASLRENK